MAYDINKLAQHLGRRSTVPALALPLPQLLRARRTALRPRRYNLSYRPSGRPPPYLLSSLRRPRRIVLSSRTVARSPAAPGRPRSAGGDRSTTNSPRGWRTSTSTVSPSTRQPARARGLAAADDAPTVEPLLGEVVAPLRDLRGRQALRLVAPVPSDDREAEEDGPPGDGQPEPVYTPAPISWRRRRARAGQAVLGRADSCTVTAGADPGRVVYTSTV
jgi:hypothetical protein